MAVNEITFLRRMIYTYKNPQNDQDFNRALGIHTNKGLNQFYKII